MLSLEVDRQTLRELVAVPGPRLSLLMPTHTFGPEAEEDRVLMRRLLAEAEVRLFAAGLDAPAADALTAPARALLDDLEFWRHSTPGLALYLAPDIQGAVRLPEPVTARLEAGPRWLLRPLLPLVAAAGSFFVLALSRLHVRLLRATRDTVRRVELSGVPASMEEALGYEEFVTAVQHHALGRGPAGERRGTIHGHGAADQENFEDDLRNYFRRVADGLRPYLAREPQAPVVLAAVEEYLPLYREASGDPRLLEAVVAGSPDRDSDEALRDRAWPLVAPALLAARDTALERFPARAGTGKTAVGVEQVLPAAAAGRVDALFLVEGAEVWGRWHAASGRVESRWEPAAGDEDLLEVTLDEVIAHGGEAWPVPPARMPAPAPVAATLRY